jgi:hypothetical protein
MAYLGAVVGAIILYLLILNTELCPEDDTVGRLYVGMP